MRKLMQEHYVNHETTKESQSSYFWVINDVYVFFIGKSAVKGMGQKNWPATAVHMYSVEFQVLSSWLTQHYFLITSSCLSPFK